MPQRMFTEAQTCELISAYVAQATERLLAHVTKRLKGDTPLATQAAAWQESEWRPPDHPPEPWDVTPPRQRHQGNGRSRHDDEGPRDDPLE